MGYKHAEDGQPIAKLSIFTTKYDKIRIIGQNGAIGFSKLSPTGYEVWDQMTYDTAPKIDRGFSDLMAETGRTLVVIYYSGHGLMDPNGSFKTCAELNQTVTSSDPNNSKLYLVYYPLQEAIELLAKKSNLFVFGILECCRAVLPPSLKGDYSRHTPRWFDSLSGQPTEGSWILFHAL